MPDDPDPQSRLTELYSGDHRTCPKRIGKYSVRRIIASGGMGTVYEAIQEHPRRKVAIKVMKRGIASKSALRRFEFESQILARLRHPNIAHVHEAGTFDDGQGGVPYFVMEYVPNAKSVTEYAAQKRDDVSHCLELFAKICDAVHHGHQKGIIHRDLKPGNIMVDSHGEPKVIDFGVARATDSDMAITTLQTDVGQLVGTLQYMSPEQCDADPEDLDTRSDVYSLGVVLYEMLCGRLPYDEKRLSMLDVARQIREADPVRPSAVNRALRGDLETVVLKALAKERDQRYRSAADLPDDIHRYLRDEPIEARPPTTTYHLRKYIRRNRVRLLASAAIGLLTIGTAIALTQVVRHAQRSRELASLLQADAAASHESIADRLAIRKLAETTISLDVESVPLELVLQRIGDEAGLNVHAEWAALDEIGVRSTVPITVSLRNVTAASMIDFILTSLGSSSESPVYTIEGGAVLVTSPDAMHRRTVTVTYDLTDLLSGVAAAGTAREDRIREIADIVIETIDPDSWTESGGDLGSIRSLADQLVIRTTKNSHRQIRRLLALLRSGGLENPVMDASEDRSLQQKRMTAADRETQKRLRETLMSVSYVDTPLRRVLDDISAQAAIDMHVEWGSLEQILGVRADDPISLELRRVTAASLLESALLLATEKLHEEAEYLVTEGVVLVTGHARSRRPLLAYDIADLLASDGSMSVEERAYEIIDMIIELVVPDSWEDNGGDVGTIRFFDESLLIRQTESTHGLVASVLAQVRGPGADRPAGDVDDGIGDQAVVAARATLRRLREVSGPWAFESRSLESILEELERVTSLPFNVDWIGLGRVGATRESLVSLTMPEGGADVILDLLLARYHDGLAGARYEIWGGSVFVGEESIPPPSQFTIVYDVSDLLEPPSAFASVAEIADAISRGTGHLGWLRSGGSVSAGRLLEHRIAVTTTPRGHLAIEDLLLGLRAGPGAAPAVDADAAAERAGAVLMDLAERSLAEGRIRSARRDLGLVSPRTRNGRWADLWARADHSALTLRGHGDGVRAAAFDPDGLQVVSLPWRGEMRVWNARTGRGRSILEAARATWVRFASDGRRIVAGGSAIFGSRVPITIWDAARGDAWTTDDALAISPSGSTIAVRADGELRLVRVSTGEVVAHVAEPAGATTSIFGDGRTAPAHLEAIAFSGEDVRAYYDMGPSLLAISVVGRSSVMLDDDDDRPSVHVESSTSDRVVLRLSPGRRHEDGDSYAVWNPAVGGRIPSLLGTPDLVELAVRGRARPVVLSPDSRFVRIGRSILDARRGVLLFQEDDETLDGMRFSPDGDRMALWYEDCTIRIRDTRSGEVLRVLHGHDNTISGVEFSADGRQLVSASRDWTVKVWGVDSSG